MALQFLILRQDDLIAVDNCAISPLPLTGLAANIGQVSFQKIEGKVQYNDRPPTPVVITDPAPYQPFINTWMTSAAALTPALQLAQAKQVKVDLVEAIFHHKRRVPYDSGGWLFEASDEAVWSLTELVEGTQSVSSDAGGIVTAINAAFATITSQVNNTVVAGANAMVAQNNASALAVNEWSLHNANNWPRMAFTYGGLVGTSGNEFYIYQTAVFDSVNYGGFRNMSAVGNIGGASITGVVSTGLSHPGNIITTPLNSATPQTFTAEQIHSIMLAIAARRNTLNTNRLGKQAAINALSTIPAVVAYDATTGWSS